MKTIPPPCPEPESGQKYWRSMDQLADTPEFRQWLEREFPQGASEWNDPVSRRHFVKIMSASFLLAGVGLTGCRRPEETILPFAKQPEDYIHGAAKYYATAMPTRGSAVPLLVKSIDGRPVKIEGNPEHPEGVGGTDTFAQAAILNLYDPDRARRFAHRGNEIPREVVMDQLASLAKQFTASEGKGLFILMEQTSSPSLRRIQSELSKKLPGARWHVHEPVDLDAAGAAISAAVGRRVSPYYRLDRAKVILSLDCDFVGSEADTQRNCRDFAKGRKVSKPGDPMNRLYAVEALYSLTGFSADHRLRVASSQVLAVAAAFATRLAPDHPAVKALAGRAALPAGVNPKWIEECAADLAQHAGECVVMAGHRQPPAVHILAQLINEALKNSGKTVQFSEQYTDGGRLPQLAQALNSGMVDTLVILGSNPVYTAPADLKWAETQRRAKTVVRLGYYEDETFALSDWHLPQAHFLESWGDVRTSDGTVVPVQPLIAPVFGGLTAIEVLARIGGLESPRAYDIVRGTFAELTGKENIEQRWGRFLHDGFLPDSAYRSIEVQMAPDRVERMLGAAGVAPAPGKESLEVVFHRDYKMDDGRHNNNGWLQEMPDPVTKVTWDAVVQVSRKTAQELQLENGDVVEVEVFGRKIQGPVLMQPGLADFTLGLALGYGRLQTAEGGTGRVGREVGLYNAYAVRQSGSEHVASGARLTKTGKTYSVACTQEHGSMEGRPIVREANWDQYKDHPKFAKNMDLESHFDYIENAPKTPTQEKTQPGRELPKMIYEHPYRAKDERGSQSGVTMNRSLKSDMHQWGMSIDLTTCVGCHACVLACQSENNVPIVGKDQVARNREMHWLRIDRYFSGLAERSNAEQMDDPQAVNMPMFCQHCENAPCESVCPVNATVHDEEGLNLMAYNRCVGTRYCSNNCPYKIRRFNFLDYNRRPMDELKGPFYPTPLTSKTGGEWTMTRWAKDPFNHHTRPEDEWDLLKLVMNPDVTVRMRGVMEKCTFCVQRIEAAKIHRKNQVGQSGAVQVPDGSFTTACAQACPTDAIVFGNLLDPESRVSKLKRDTRDYSVLAFLDTRPRLTYMARIRNPNPKMPDYYKYPLNLKEYMDDRHANPFEEHGAPHGEPHGAPSEKTSGQGGHHS